MFSARHGTAVTPSDTVEAKFHALYIGGTGDVAVTAIGDTTAVTFKSVPAGTVLWISTYYVMATGTTATNIVGMN